MKELWIALFTLILMCPLSAPAANIAGVEIPDALNKAGLALVLNGAGTRSKFFMDIYISALYLEQTSQDAELILRADKPIGLRLHIVSGLVDSDDLKDAIKDGFEDATGGNLQPIQSQIDQFMKLMNAETQKGDYFDFIYLPQTGLKIYKNDTYQEDIKGLSFKRAFFGIWLGDEPADEDLREEMLGL